MIDKLVGYINSINIWFETELLLRIIIALLCGALIGRERTNRGKEAGIRTHTIVALAACLMMIISQYGFDDFFTQISLSRVELRHDPSRIAAQIVSGIGFLGAGMIFVQKNMVTGLTTAAGIWAVAGIGMAIGCGMYFIGIICSVVIIIVQFIMHKYSMFSNTHIESKMKFNITDDKDAILSLLKILEKFEITVLNISYNKIDDNMLEISIHTQHSQKIDKKILIQEIYSEENIKLAKV